MMEMVEEEENGLRHQRTAREAQWTGTGAGAAGSELPGRLGCHAVYRGEGNCCVSTCLGGNSNKVMLRKFVEDLTRHRRGVARSFEEGIRVLAQEAVPVDIILIICEA